MYRIAFMTRRESPSLRSRLEQKAERVRLKTCANRCITTSEMKVGFQENELPVRIVRVDFCNHTLSPGVSVVQSGTEGSRNLIVGAEVPDVSQTPAAIRRP